MSQHAFKTAIVLFSLGALPSQARSALESLALEAARAKQVVTKLPESVVGAEERRSLEQQQATVEELLRANRTHAALHVLLRLSRYVDAQGFRALHAADIKQGLDALERDWAANGIERRGQAAAYERPAGGGAFAAARALSESAYYESRIVYEASKLYGTQVGADAGYFYLGESRALMDYALFCRGLGAPTARRPPELRPLAPFLATLETELLEAYGRDTATPEHAAFARANGSLKLARELLGERSRLGALYQYLLAELALGLAGAAEAPDAAKLRERAESLERRLAGSKADHSLGQAFVELARSGLERAQGAADPKPLLQNARVLLERVLPAYLDVAGEDLR
jgi:hypothetical protein